MDNYKPTSANSVEYIINNILFTQLSESEKFKFLMESGLYYYNQIEHQKPDNLFNILNNKYYENNYVTYKSLLHEMNYIQQKLESYHVLFAFLKGPLLGEILYGDSFIRHTSDIDLYVELSRVSEVMDALGEIGYKSEEGVICTGKDAIFDFYRGRSNMKILGRHSVYFRHTNNIIYTLELHITPFRHYNKCTNKYLKEVSTKLLQKPRYQVSNGTQYRTLDHIFNFLSMTVHFARHIVEEITKYCTDKKQVKYITLSHLFDLEKYIELYPNLIMPESLLNVATELHCTADLAMAARYLGELFHKQEYIDLFMKCVNIDIDDTENNIYIEICKNLSIYQIMFYKRAAILSVLKDSVKPVSIYYCKSNDGDFPIADCNVVEYCEDSKKGFKESDRYSFSWGASKKNDILLLTIKMKLDSIEFINEGIRKKSNTSIRLYYPVAECGKDCDRCLTIEEINIYIDDEKLFAMSSKHESEDGKNEIPLLLIGGSIVLHYSIDLRNIQSELLKFMITREVSLPRNTTSKRRCNFAVRWVDIVSVSHSTCLSCGALKINNNAVRNSKTENSVMQLQEYGNPNT